MNMETALTRDAGIQVPMICGAMYPCSNPELVAAVSEAGGIGIIQPVSLVYAHGYKFEEGLRQIRVRTDKPVGFNAIVEQSSRAYSDRMRRWIDIALEDGVRFFVTALGKPGWVVDLVHAAGGVVYHDVTELKWAKKALDSGVDGLIAVNDRAGGHAGERSPQQLLEELGGLGVPVVCAGGIGNPEQFRQVLDMGYAGVQMGTRFIAATECSAHDDYKQAIVKAGEDDIVLTDLLSGVPCSVIRTPYVERVGTKAGPLARRLLRGKKTRHWMRMFYTLRAARQLKQASMRGISYKDFFQAGKSVDGISQVESAADILRSFTAA